MRKNSIRHVTDDEFRKAYWGDPSDPDSLRAAADNRGIIEHVLRRYRRVMNQEDLEALGMTALWRTLGYHDPNRGKKFTTNLYMWVNREVQKELERDRKHCAEDERFVRAARAREDLRGEGADGDEIEAVRENLPRLLYAWQRRVLTQYYLDGLSYEEVGIRNGYSKEKARHRVEQALQELRNLCI